MKSGSDLLLLFHWLATRDQGPAGFAGTLAVGVRGDDAVETWWSAKFGSTTVASELRDRCPVEADCALSLTDEEANRIMDRGTLPAGLGPDRLTGDRELFSRFLERYVKKRSMFDVRSSS